MANAKDILEAFGKLESDRASFDGLYRECAEYCMPPEQAIGQRNQPVQEGREYIGPVDSIGIRCAQLLASGLYSNTISSGQQWFRLRSRDEKLNDHEEVKAYWDAVSDRSLKALQNSNFSLEVHELHVAFVVFGTGVMFSELTDGARLSFQHHSVRNVYLAEGLEGRIDTLYRQFWLTATQAVRKFPKSVSSEVRRAASNPQTAQDKYPFVHYVGPRESVATGAKGARAMPYASLYIERKAETIVSESGFEEFPFAAPRFSKLDGEVYGRSPAMSALPDLRMVSRASEDWIDAVEMAVVPPVFLPDVEGMERTDLRPGAINVYDPTRGGSPVMYKAGGDTQVGMDFITRKDTAIEQMFMVDLFQMFQAAAGGKNMTATEVAERVGEKIQAIAPVVSRLQSELYQPVIERVVTLLGHAGLLPDPPAVLRGSQYDVVYTSRLDARLSETENRNMLKFLAEAGQAVQIVSAAPALTALVDIDQIIKRLAQNDNVPATLIRTTREVEKHRKQMAQAQAQAQQRQLLADKIAPVDITKPIQDESPMMALAAAAASGMAGME